MLGSSLHICARSVRTQIFHQSTQSVSKGKILLEKQGFALTIKRLCYSLIEQYNSFDDACIIGIQPRGSKFAERIVTLIKEIQDTDIQFGKLDITFYRDDYRTRSAPRLPNKMDLPFIIEGKKVILVDDVLYTGRTIQAALSALQDFGRPSSVELVALVDRRFNRNIPIQPDYSGLTVDALDHAYIRVNWEDVNGIDQILLFKDKSAADQA